MPLLGFLDNTNEQYRKNTGGSLMNEFSSKQYSKDEVDRIIRRALKLKTEDSISHQELMDTAREFGIDPQTLEAAIEEDKEEFEKERVRKTRLLRRKSRFYRHLWSYFIVIGALLLINILTPGPWWFQWPALGWGIGLAFNFKAAFFPVQKDMASENSIIIP
jgi:hypothetical protein